jgi:hypothetical protein
MTAVRKPAKTAQQACRKRPRKGRYPEIEQKVMSKRKGTKRMSIIENPEAALSGTATMGAAAATAMSMESVESSHSVTDHEELARLAYSYWIERGCPEGSPDEDWFRAETTLREQARETLA